MNTISTPIIFSFLFLLAAFTYATIGVYLLSRNIKASLNRLFFLICCSLTIWAFAYALAHTAPDHDAALFWHRISALGWGTVHSLILHYYLFLTERHRFLKRPVFCFLLYVPALTTLVLFGPLGSLAAGQYELMYLGAGWIDVSAPGFPERFYEAYYLSYSALSLVVLWIWGQTRTNPTARTTVRLIGLAYLVTLTISTLTDVIFRQTQALDVPQMGILFALITIIAIFYATLKHGFMAMLEAAPALPGQILSETSRIRMYRYLALSFVAGSTLNMCDYFFRGEPLFRVTLFSGALFFCAMLLMLLPHTSLTHKNQDNLMVAVVAGSYPLMMLYYLESASSNIVWPACE